MNRYRVIYTALEGKLRGRVIRAVDETKALQLFHAPFQFTGVPVTVHSVKQFANESVDQLFQRYTRNLSQLDEDRYGGIQMTVSGYWADESWGRLSNLLYGAVPFCDDPRVRRDMTVLMLFAKQQDASSNPLHTD